jgi:hypothetical protein
VGFALHDTKSDFGEHQASLSRAGSGLAFGMLGDRAPLRLDDHHCECRASEDSHFQLSTPRPTHITMATAFRALRLAQRAPIARQMPVSRIASALPRTYATATVREATPDKPVEQAERQLPGPVQDLGPAIEEAVQRPSRRVVGPPREEELRRAGSRGEDNSKKVL